MFTTSYIVHPSARVPYRYYLYRKFPELKKTEWIHLINQICIYQPVTKHVVVAKAGG